MTLQNTLEERGSKYGQYISTARIIQNIKEAMMHSPNWNELSNDKKESLEMIAHKIGRILNGDPNYADSWVDIAGYAQLIVNNLNGNPT